MKYCLLVYLCCLVGFGCVKATSIDACLAARRDERVRAFLDVIAYAEGTYQFGALGYSARYPMRWFSGFKHHPGFVFVKKRSGRIGKYSASGRYMFLIKTWDYLSKRLGLRDFGPLNQDIGAVALLAQKGALAAILKNDFDCAIALANKTWATFPGSPYGQKTTPMAELKRLYNERVLHYRGGGAL